MENADKYLQVHTFLFWSISKKRREKKEAYHVCECVRCQTKLISNKTQKMKQVLAQIKKVCGHLEEKKGTNYCKVLSKKGAFYFYLECCYKAKVFNESFLEKKFSAVHQLFFLTFLYIYARYLYSLQQKYFSFNIKDQCFLTFYQMTSFKDVMISRF